MLENLRALLFSASDVQNSLKFSYWIPVKAMLLTALDVH